MEPFSALLLSSDPATVTTTQKILEDNGVSVKRVESALAAEQLIKTAKFDLGILDHDLPGALSLAAARSTFANPKMIFALLRANQVKEVQGKSVHFVVQKPFTTDLFARSLRAASGPMIRDRRLAFRHVVKIVPATSLLLQEQSNQQLHSVNILDLSQAGMCVQTMEILGQGSSVQIDFHLPDTRELIHVTGTVMWTRASGRTGVKFTHVPPEELKTLVSWLDSKLPYDLESIPRVLPPGSSRERVAQVSL